MSVIKSLSKYGLALPVGIGNLITKGLEKVTGKEYGRTSVEEAAQTTFGKVLGTTIVGTAAALGVAAAGVPATIKALTPTTALGKATSILAIGAASTSPKVVSAVLETPFKIFETGQQIGTAVEELPTQVQEEAGDLGKYGLIGAGIGALSTGIIGGLILGADEKITEIKEELPINAISETPKAIPQSNLPVIQESEVETPLSSVTTPIEETTVGTPTKKRKKKRKEAPRQTISQRVDVRVGVNAGNKKYIKNTIYV